MRKKQKKWVRLGIAVGLAVLGTNIKDDISSLATQLQHQGLTETIGNVLQQKEEAPRNQTTPRNTLDYDKQQYNQLASLDFQTGVNAVLEVNNGQATLDISQWQENKVIYGDLDSLNRTTSVTAFIDQRNLGHSEGRERQIWQPTGWHQKRVDGKEIVNRGHLLAYTSSFNIDVDGNFKEGESGSQDNPKNLATQTAFSNQKVQTHYEKLVRDAQKIIGNKILYQIVTVFRGNELMPRGYWLQAVDSAGTLNFNVYEYNVQPSVVFNYEDGTSRIDRDVQVNWNE